MSYYQCGHDGEPVILDNNLLSATFYFEWVNSVGFEGTKEQCFKCWNKEKV